METLVKVAVPLAALMVGAILFELRHALVMYSLEPLRLRRTQVLPGDDFAHDLSTINPCMLSDASVEAYSAIAREALARVVAGEAIRLDRCARTLSTVFAEHGCEASPLRLRESARVLQARARMGALH